MLSRYFADVPPGFEGQPILYLLTVFSLLMITLLALEWVWRVTWGAFEQPHPLKHPVTVLRLILALAAISVIMRVGPLVARFILWRDLSPEQRFTTYGISH